MKRLILLLAMFLAATAFAEEPFPGVRGLVVRLGGEELSSKLRFEKLAAAGDLAKIKPAGADYFVISATNPRAASLAVGEYLRTVAKGHISWCGNRLPKKWTLPTKEIVVKPLHPLAIAYNYCTLSYTMAFWDKAAWQAEIDRLALNGYNVALVTIGLQKVWDLTLKDMHYTPEERAAYIADDAASAWWHMGNLQGAGMQSKVSAEQIERDAALGAWLVKAMRQLGIEPIFQGFVGVVPSSTSSKHVGEARVFKMGNWLGMKSPDVLDPNSAAFKTYTECWFKNLKRVYALTTPAEAPKYLGGDLFHENVPPSSMNAEQKTNCARKVQEYQQAAFPGVTWVLQSWQGSPVQELRNGLNPKFTLIERLDQSMHETGERDLGFKNNLTGEYLPWVWVEVLNFGGNTGMHGAFRRFTTMGTIGATGPAHQEFRGYGLLSEGLETNPISYDLFNSRFTCASSAAQNLSVAELSRWMHDYRLRRYGYDDDNLAKAYKICAETVWTCKRDQQGTVESVFCAYPSLKVDKVSAWGPTTGTPYDEKLLIEAAKGFLASAKGNPKLLKLETFRYDFVEIFQQVLADDARKLLPSCTEEESRKRFLKELALLVQLLAQSERWCLSFYEARTKAKCPEGPALYRQMITTWRPASAGVHTPLAEYAHRSYAELVAGYYAPRWKEYFAVLAGKRTQKEYEEFLAELNRTFPTAKLRPIRPANLITIADTILKAVE